jgi:hypothetical protein
MPFFHAPTNKTAPIPGIRFTGDGRLLRPSGYRTWTYVGTPLTPNDMNGGNAPFPEFHSVYINTRSYDQYGKTGEFPDGMVLIKELVSVGSKEATSGHILECYHDAIEGHVQEFKGDLGALLKKASPWQGRRPPL